MIHTLLGNAPVDRPQVIGMVHLEPLPGAPQYRGRKQDIREAMLRDVAALVAGGVDALMLENYGDAPFYPDRVPPHVVAEMSALAECLRREFDAPLGVNVLRNDGLAAMSVAAASGARFIRVNVLCGGRLTDQGPIEGKAHEVTRLRRRLEVEVAILADINVKHSAPLAARPLADEVRDLIDRASADGIVVSGRATGKAVEAEEFRQVSAAAGETPVLMGSGVTPEDLSSPSIKDAGWRPPAAYIVGTAFKEGGVTAKRVSQQRVQAFMNRLQDSFSNPS